MEVDWGGLKKETPKHGPSLTEVDWGGKYEANHRSGCMLSEVDWGAHESSLFLYLEEIDHGRKPQDFFTLGLWGGLLHGKFPLTTMGQEDQ